MSSKYHLTKPGFSVLRWFILNFSAISVIFLIALFPSLNYSKKIFVDLELQKFNRQLESGSKQLESIYDSVTNFAHYLGEDPRFMFLQYDSQSFTSADYNTQIQLKDALHTIIYPIPMITDCYLQLGYNLAATPTTTFTGKINVFYPDYFAVNELSFLQWEELLKENKTGFLPMVRVSTIKQEYDAVVFATKCGQTGYLFVTMKAEDIRNTFFPDDNSDKNHLIITGHHGQIIYDDSVQSSNKTYSLHHLTETGNLNIEIQIDDSVLSDKQKPLRNFITIYLAACSLVSFISIVFFSFLSSSPLHRILSSIADDKDGDCRNKRTANNQKHLNSGFEYIQNYVNYTEEQLTRYESVLSEQQTLLRARFLEKAMSGLLITQQDIHSFNTFHSDFPKEFCLVNLHLIYNNEIESENVQDPISLIQSILMEDLSGNEYLRIDNCNLIIVIAHDRMEQEQEIIEHKLAQINEENQAFHLVGAVSDIYYDWINLPTAYQQVLAIDYHNVNILSTSFIHPENYLKTNLSNHPNPTVITFYSAISTGNPDVSLQILEGQADRIISGSHTTTELFRLILRCIKLEHPKELLSINIPVFDQGKTGYEQLKETVMKFCTALQSDSENDTDPFVQKLIDYIDEHFCENQLCQTSIADHFDCSVSKIQRAFRQNYDMTISSYIERKRMQLANELLMKGEYSITEISEICGFSNANSFYKAYQRVYGFAPSKVKGSSPSEEENCTESE